MGKVLDKKKDTKKNNNKKGKQISLFTIMLILGVVAVLVGIYFGVRYLVITLKYKVYTDKMYTYGYNELYNNKKATATDMVYNVEMSKVIMGSIRNENNIDNLYYSDQVNISDNEKWNKLLIDTNVNPSLTISTMNNKATKIDSVITAVRVLESSLSLNTPLAKLDMDENNLKNFTQEEREIISKAVTLGIIKNDESALSKSNILKGELNKLIITLVEKYATMYYNTTELNENAQTVKQNIKIVTDNDKLPSNFEEYPYIVDNIPNSVYEYDFKILAKEDYINPKRTYKIMKDLYGQIDDDLTNYLDKILNIDYTNITVDKLMADIENQVTYELDKEQVERYVDYVKDNKVKLEGKVTPLLPIIYFNGETFSVRAKVDLKVLSSDTKYNLLFGDEGRKIKYNGDNISMYVDLPMGITLTARSLRAMVCCTADYLTVTSESITIEQ